MTNIIWGDGFFWTTVYFSFLCQFAKFYANISYDLYRVETQVVACGFDREVRTLTGGTYEVCWAVTGFYRHSSTYSIYLTNLSIVLIVVSSRFIDVLTQYTVVK